jgi:MFS family permease
LVFFASVGSYLDEFDALIANDFNLELFWVSIILTIRLAFVAVGDLLAPIVGKKITTVKGIFLLSGLSYAFLLLFSIIWNQYFLLAFGLSFMILAIAEILLVNILQNEIKEEGRATVMSFYGIGQNLVMILFSLTYALLAGLFALQQVYIIISIFGIVGGVSFYLLSLRRAR